ncbi:hypothetical protein PIB30_066885 [Stylosanthes scabra]|uniref:LRR and NB-ARC domain disease resistance protein n=1 Tax=Stylosanthes scabra TaxID=79078 RepID=A0ABU6TN12_9FABA|nr:hypothetical protein [Stylosanthes scabra]
MATALVGGAFLSATIQTLLDNISSSEFRDYFRSTLLDGALLDELETTLLTLQIVLDDAEEKQFTNPLVKQWLAKLKDVVLNTEDLLDEIGYDSLRCKVEAATHQDINNQVRDLISSPFNQFYKEINSKMEMMLQRLKPFVAQKDILNLQSVSRRVSHRTPTSSLVNESAIVGRNDDKEKLVNMLLSDSDNGINGGSNIGVIAILGMGGVGKTTLAQLLYNNEQVQEHFGLKAWVCVSEDFDALRVTKTLLKSIAKISEDHDTENLDFLRVELKQRLRGKKFLFVLDDLWNDKYNDWDELMTPFSSGKNGSKVIITTRQHRVAEVAHTFPIHRLEPLSDEECWCLICKHAFGGEGSGRYPHLEVIGRKLARKCSGLPLAAKTLGGLLRSRVDAKEWSKVLNSNIWNLPNNDVLPALRLSYLYLSTHLKRCFAYCSIFPKGYQLDEKNLVLLWMAEGLVNSEADKEMEEIGEDYFIELVQRSLIEPSTVGSFAMHDLVNDLARDVSGRSCFRFEHGKIPLDVRHLSYELEVYDSSEKFEDFYELKSLRSFIPLSPVWLGKTHLSRKVLDDLLPSLKCLRVLSLARYSNITNLPTSIGNLVHLRYLDLSYTEIQRLPDSTCSLYNLQTLILFYCYFLIELPTNIGKLVNLRHLDISGTRLEYMPMQIVDLPNLKTLTAFVVDKKKQGQGLSVGELRKLPHLQCKLSMKNLQNVVEANEAIEANLKSKEKIEEIEFGWGETAEDSRIQKEVLEQLEPSKNLRKLAINFYGGTSFPNWLGDASFTNLASISISYSAHCISLPPLGQLPFLKSLDLFEMEFLSIGPEFYGKAESSTSSFQPFPSLEVLVFLKMPNWEEWLSFGTEGREFPFPNLQAMQLVDCPQLRGSLPLHLPSLAELHIEGCDRLLLGNDEFQYCKLNHLKISNRGYYSQLVSISRMILSSNVLQHLTLQLFPSLTEFPAEGLPTSLQSLEITCCWNLEFLPSDTWCNYTCLTSLKLWQSCHSMTCFLLDGFPALKNLEIASCEDLQSIMILEDDASQFPLCLEILKLSACEKLTLLPASFDKLKSLQELIICNLPNIVSLPRLPPNLASLEIRQCAKLLPASMIEAGLQSLTSLSKCSLGWWNDELVDTLMKDRILPTSLVSLEISILHDLKSIEGHGIGHLTSLERLEICHCSALDSMHLPRLMSLRHLRIFKCPRLEALPEDSLSSLNLLCIEESPLLEARYERGGEDWHKIAHIPAEWQREKEKLRKIKDFLYTTTLNSAFKPL